MLPPLFWQDVLFEGHESKALAAILSDRAVPIPLCTVFPAEGISRSVFFPRWRANILQAPRVVPRRVVRRSRCRSSGRFARRAEGPRVVGLAGLRGAGLFGVRSGRRLRSAACRPRLSLLGALESRRCAPRRFAAPSRIFTARVDPFRHSMGRCVFAVRFGVSVRKGFGCGLRGCV